MTTKTITDTIITTGYTLSSAYNVLSITSTGTIDGAAGAAGRSGGSGGRGGIGLKSSNGAAVYNAGVIVGGQGGAQGAGKYGGAGGYGVFLGGGSLTNSATIVGGLGEAGNLGGYGVFVSSGSVTNSGMIVGGQGGAYGNDSDKDGGYGSTGVAVLLKGELTNLGMIDGGQGGAGGVGGHAGGGGAGAVVSGTLMNEGTIIGGAVGGTPFRAPGNGVDLGSGGKAVNAAGGLIGGFIGVVFDGRSPGSTITNFGTIEGASGLSVLLQATNQRLIAEAGSTWIGSVQAHGGTLELASGTGTLTGLGATGTVSGAEAMTISGFGSYVLDAGSSWTLTGTNAVYGGSVFALTNAGTLFVAGTVKGAGILTTGVSTIEAGADLNLYRWTVDGGTTTVDAGVGVSVAFWQLSKGTTYLDESVAAGRVFNVYGAATLSVAAGDTLTITGYTRLYGHLSGAGVVSVDNANLNGLMLTGAAHLDIAGTVSPNGNVTVGGVGAGASLTILSTGVWDVGAGSIVHGAASGGALINDGVLIKNAGTGVSSVGVATTDDGVIEAAMGTLVFTGKLSGTGLLKIDAGATLEVDSPAVPRLSAVFTGSSATLALVQPKHFYATISGFAPGDTIHLIHIFATNASINARDQLVIVNGAITVATLQLKGRFGGTPIFSIAGDGSGGTTITLIAAAGVPPSPHGLAAAMAGMAPAGGVALHSRDTNVAHAPMLARPGTQIA